MRSYNLFSSSCGGTRTLNIFILSEAPLPIGPRSHGAGDGSRTRHFLFTRQAHDHSCSTGKKSDGLHQNDDCQNHEDDDENFHTQPYPAFTTRNHGAPFRIRTRFASLEGKLPSFGQGMEPERGIEPRWLVYETSALPLSYSGMVPTAGVEPGIRLVISKLAGTARLRSVSKMVHAEGFEPPTPSV